MIFGIGCDIIQIDRIEKLLASSGDAFLKRVFTEGEREHAEKYKRNKASVVSHFAKRFAAKEAFAKALGTGFGATISMQDVGVKNDEAGNPYLSLSEKAEKALERITGGETVAHLSLSDDHPVAMAVVIIEKRT